MVGFICASYEVQTVVMGAGLTAAVVMALTIFALTTEVESLQLLTGKHSRTDSCSVDFGREAPKF